MAKTRSQTGNITINRKEESSRSTLGVNSVTRTTRNKITKKRPSKSNTSPLPAQDVKVEEDTDIKALLQSSPKKSKLPKGQQVSQEQINRLIDAIVNDKLGIYKAARKANVSPGTASRYYNVYKNDPEKKIPSPRIRDMKNKRVYVQQDIENLIAYIENEKMSVKKASAKANMTCIAGSYYYNKYLQDPDHNIPITYIGQHYTQDQKEVFIGYIVNDKMSIRAASKKASISNSTGRKYCREYFKGKNPIIPAPSHIAPYTHYTQKQINNLIRYIVNDKMSVRDASRKIAMCSETAKRHYYQYLKDNNMDLPTQNFIRPCTQEEKNQLIPLIVDEKMSVMAAAKKLTVPYTVAQKCYRQYLKDHNIKVPPRHTQDEINKFIGYIVDDKMTRSEAAKKARMGDRAAKKHYYQYLTDNNLDLPIKKYTQDEKDKFISYIVDDKMNVMGAAKKANMPATTAARYYRQYLKDHNIDLPVPKTFTQDQIDEFISYIVDDKMTMKAATKKANMSGNTGSKYYNQYLKDHNLQILNASYTTQDKIDEFIGCMIDDKMTLKAASEKAKICVSTGRKYYRQYLEDHNLDVPIQKRFTQDELNEFIGYIVRDKMSIKAAAKKANMSDTAAAKYYRQYRKENNLPVAAPNIITQDQVSALIGYIVDDKMTVNAASKKANMTCTTGSKYYQQYLNNQ